MSELIITPKTKVLELIEAYPQLEDILIDYAPAFKKLKNPVLRKTVARIATLQQAAAVGHVKVEDLINRLRSEVGQDLFSGQSSVAYNTVKPGWFSEDSIDEGLDARERPGAAPGAPGAEPKPGPSQEKLALAHPMSPMSPQSKVPVAI